MKHFFYGIIILCLPAFCNAQVTSKPNIIFFIMDDMNDWVEGYDGHPQTITPNISLLESKGTTFYNSYCNAPQCGPSRSSLLTGKDVAYTQVYSNTTIKCKFSDNFTEAKGNSEYFTIPGYFKDSAGYYTYCLNKIFHCYEDYAEYDAATPDECSKKLSWNKLMLYTDSILLVDAVATANDGVSNYKWGRLDPSLESSMQDYVGMDSGIAFLQQVAAGDLPCGEKPFFLGVGIKKPHFPLFIPEQYFLNDYYFPDTYETPYQIPFNYKNGATPYNGVVLAPQTEPPYQDYDALPYLGKAMSGEADNSFSHYHSTLGGDIPIINPTLSLAQRNAILDNSKRANIDMAYLAAIRYADAQMGRLMDELALHPDIYNNTIIVLIGDHGFALGEKKHWQKTCMWETDIRAPFIIADLRNPVANVNHNTVSFIDIFPTLCDMAGVAPPAFSDGSPYPDGKSLVPYMANPSKICEQPVLSTIKNSKGLECSCYPQFSVRDSRFHLIRYQSNNGTADPILCDFATSYEEQELYEIGSNKEVDPYEFHNLIDDPEYAQEINYLSQWLPDGPMYLKPALKSVITTPTSLACLLDSDDTIGLGVKLFDTDGSLLSAAGMSNYTYLWSNNLNAETSTESVYSFHMSAVTPSVYAAASRLIIYLSVMNSAGSEVSFTMKYFYVNPLNIPVADYTVVNSEGKKIVILGYSITGSYTNTSWNFGDGFTSDEFIPGPHTYAESASYIVKNTVNYGNGCKIIKSKGIIIPPSGISDRLAKLDCSIYPNPASSFLNIVSSEDISEASFEILNIPGEIMQTGKANLVKGSSYTMDISALPPGIYFLKIAAQKNASLYTFVVAGHEK